MFRRLLRKLRHKLGFKVEGLKPERQKWGLLLHHSSYGDAENIEYHDFHVAVGQPAGKEKAIFLPSAQAHKLARKGKLKEGKGVLGSATVRVDKANKLIWWSGFSPIGFENFSLRESGVGAIVHAAIVARLAKQFPDYRIEHQSANDNRQLQLAQMGIDYKKTYPIRKYWEISRDYLKKKFKEYPLPRNY